MKRMYKLFITGRVRNTVYGIIKEVFRIFVEMCRIYSTLNKYVTFFIGSTYLFFDIFEIVRMDNVHRNVGD